MTLFQNNVLLRIIIKVVFQLMGTVHNSPRSGIGTNTDEVCL